MQRRAFVTALAGSALPWSAPALAANYPDRPVELVVPFQAGGGTDALARAFADAARKHFAQPLVVVNKPGASGAIGWNDVINSKAEGYKMAVMTVEITTLPHLGLAKFTHEDFVPIARLNADPAAINLGNFARRQPNCASAAFTPFLAWVMSGLCRLWRSLWRGEAVCAQAGACPSNISWLAANL